MPFTFQTYLNKQTKAAPLAVFRILFGLLLVVSMIRFWYYGWIEKLYLLPKFHFHYYGFEWVQVPGNWTYALFFICGLSALFFAIGFKYRISILIFFLSFTYIELMDKTTYLNHYYFVSITAFILLWLPAHCHFSVDAFWNKNMRTEFIPKWNIDALRLMISIVYISAGLAKLNSDWMYKALPLGIWLREKTDIPIIGQFMDERWMHYLFSWGGACYDLFIVFFLLWSRTRLLAFIAVLIFHLLTKVLFPIGMFPYLMIAASLLFFSDSFHSKILATISRIIKIPHETFCNGMRLTTSSVSHRTALFILPLFFVVQLLVPLRSHLYTGNVFWTEQGYRFSWRVMLMEKTGYANFKVVDGVTGKRFYVQNEDFLTAFQQKQMATQPDFILEYAHYLGEHFKSQGHKNLQIFVESYASLNGRPSQEFIDPSVDLLTVKNNLLPKSFIIPLKND
jgi:hypothetical protein